MIIKFFSPYFFDFLINPHLHKPVNMIVNDTIETPNKIKNKLIQSRNSTVEAE